MTDFGVSKALMPSQPDGLVTGVGMRCLEKRPAVRFQTAHELMAALEELPSGNHTAPTLPARPRGTRLRWLPAGAVLLAAAVLWGVTRRSDGNAQPVDGHTASVAVLPPEYFRPDSAVAGTVADLVDHISNNLSRVEALKVVNYAAGTGPVRAPVF